MLCSHILGLLDFAIDKLIFYAVHLISVSLLSYKACEIGMACIMG
jgi:hypothetical protein